MRRPIGIAAALTLATAIAGVPTQPRASLIQSAAWTVATAPAVNAPAVNASVEPTDPAPSIALTNGDSRGDGVFVNIDSAGGVALFPATMFSPTSPVRSAAQVEHSAIADDRGCDSANCATVDLIPLSAGTAAFQFESFIGNAVSALRFVFDSRAGGDSYASLGMVGIGNFALVAAGLIGLSLTRRRDYTPPG
jgi:hypothetical protein